MPNPDDDKETALNPRPRAGEEVTPYFNPESSETTVALNLGDPVLRPLAERFELLQEVGRGGMGVVYKVRDRETGEVVALKVLLPEIAARPDLIERFKSELRLARKITHKNVCRTYDLHRFGATAAIAMEYVEGESLRALLRRVEGLSVRHGLKIIRQVLAGLGEAHAQGVVHRDLKPENIVIARDGTAKMMDFGIARSLDSNVTQTGMLIGTPAYMSPEQAEGRPVDARSDIYTLGLILYEMLTGQPAFRGETPVALAVKQLLESPSAPRELEAYIPPFLERALLRCLEKDPSKRFQSVGELGAALSGKPAAEAPGPAAAASQAAWWEQRWVFAAAALVLGLVLGASAWFWREPPRAYWKIPAAAPKQVLRQSGEVFQAALSPDGNQFVYVLDKELYLQALPQGEPRQLTHDGFPKLLPRFSPDGTQILFSRQSPEGSDSSLYVLDLPAGLPRLLLEDASKGVWSPDGGQLAFVRATTPEAFVAKADGSSPHSLGPAAGFDWALGLSWAPDGRSLAVVHKGRLFLVSADGRARQELEGVKVSDALFAPDGKFLLVMGRRGGYWTILEFPVKDLTAGKGIPFNVVPYEASGATLDRDGEKLLVAFYKLEFHLALAEQAEEAVPERFKQITFGAFELYPTLSPDERKIAYTDGDSLWIVNTDGTDPRRLPASELSSAVDPAWSPDGQRIALADGGEEELWLIRLDEGKPRKFSPVAGKKRSPSFTADGKQVVFTLIREDKTDIWWAPAEGGEARALTTGGVSSLARAAPVGNAIAYLRKTPAGGYEARVLDTETGRDRTVATPEALARFGQFSPHAPRWSREARSLFLSMEKGLVRVGVDDSSISKFSFALPRSFFWEAVPASFDVFSDSRRIVFARATANMQPWLYDKLE